MRIIQIKMAKTQLTKKDKRGKPVEFDGCSSASLLVNETCRSAEWCVAAAASTASTSSFTQLVWLALPLQLVWLALHEELSSALSRTLSTWLISWLSHWRRCFCSEELPTSCRTTTSCRLVAVQSTQQLQLLNRIHVLVSISQQRQQQTPQFATQPYQRSNFTCLHCLPPPEYKNNSAPYHREVEQLWLSISSNRLSTGQPRCVYSCDISQWQCQEGKFSNVDSCVKGLEYKKTFFCALVLLVRQ